MSQLQQLFDGTETTFLQQGLKILQDENEASRKLWINRFAPGDPHVPAIVEGLDRRAAQLHAFQQKLAALANSS